MYMSKLEKQMSSHPLLNDSELELSVNTLDQMTGVGQNPMYNNLYFCGACDTGTICKYKKKKKKKSKIVKKVGNAVAITYGVAGVVASKLAGK